MGEVLKQKRWPEYKIFEIVEDGIKLEVRTNEFYNMQTIKFEKIGFEEQVKRLSPTGLSVALFISFLFNICFAGAYIGRLLESTSKIAQGGISAGLIVGLSVFAYQIFKFNKEKFIIGEVALSFWYYKKDMVKVDQFIDKLKQAKKDYFRKKYFVVDESEEFEYSLQKFNWLKSLEYITEEEHKDLTKELTDKKVIKGF